jgi:hypothetical protein
MREQYGDPHPDTLTALRNLADIETERGDLEAALDRRRQVLARRLEHFGNRHPDTSRARRALPSTLILSGSPSRPSSPRSTRRPAFGMPSGRTIRKRSRWSA